MGYKLLICIILVTTIATWYYIYSIRNINTSQQEKKMKICSITPNYSFGSLNTNQQENKVKSSSVTPNYMFCWSPFWNKDNYDGNMELQKENKETSISPATVKYVLYWSPFWNQKDYYVGFGNEPFKGCEYTNCFATDNRTLMPLEQYDALIIHSTYNKKKHGVPWNRSANQRYVFMNLEAPQYMPYNLNGYAHYFNWTMSYRIDSDIVRRHGYIIKTETGYQPPSKESIRNKNKSIAWFVSHCNTSSKREVLVEKINKQMKVDIFGACSKMKCKRSSNPKLSSEECYDMVERDYKFYLSFENSFCKDYSTEKLYNVLLRNVIPIVYGFGDYSKSAPPYSVIDVNNFETVKDLTNYLHFLSENEDEYLKYFEWKKTLFCRC